MTEQSFPDDFVWGVAASAFQIEGAEGRGRSVWDEFCDRPGAIGDGSNGHVACGHVDRYKEDADLIAGLGVNAYRFSVSWPRLFPDDRRTLNAAGLDFYDRLTDSLLARGIDPWICVHHWDLPSYLEAEGGWRSRDSAGWFAEFCGTVMARLGDRVPYAAPFNEPNVVPWVAYDAGHHAPGRQTKRSTLAAIHHINLAQGRAFEAMRAASPRTRLGGIYSLAPVHSRTQTPADIRAARYGDLMWRRVMLDPLILGEYPSLIAEEIAPLVQENDLDVICQPLDYFGLNHYSRLYIEADETRHFGATETSPPSGVPVTEWGWQIDASALLEQLRDFGERYPSFDAPIIITENGAAFADVQLEDGSIEDRDRIAFFSQYLGAVLKAIELGFDIKGYFFWSILDNFEWNAGYTKRFGLVHIDYESLRRTPKASYHFVSELMSLMEEQPRRAGEFLRERSDHPFPRSA